MVFHAGKTILGYLSPTLTRLANKGNISTVCMIYESLLESIHVRVMVSLNRQGHIVTRYGKFRNITLHSCSASSPLPRVANQHLAVDPTARDNVESELKAAMLSLVSTPRGTSLRRPERNVTRGINLCARADVSEGRANTTEQILLSVAFKHARACRGLNF